MHSHIYSYLLYCIVKTAAKTKTNVSLQIGVPKKINVCTQPDRVLFYKVR